MQLAAGPPQLVFMIQDTFVLSKMSLHTVQPSHGGPMGQLTLPNPVKHFLTGSRFALPKQLPAGDVRPPQMLSCCMGLILDCRLLEPWDVATLINALVQSLHEFVNPVLALLTL